LITGGAGFIGSNLVHYWFERYPGDTVVVLDKLTYAGNRENLAAYEGRPNFRFVHGDVCDPVAVRDAMAGCDAIIHAAADTHVDRSILSGGDFVQTDVFGTFVMLEAARELGIQRFCQISTDEVYGTIPPGQFSLEADEFRPSSPYAASKAGADRLAFSYFVTYGLPVVITRAANNYGPYQYPEKQFPLFVTNAMDDQPLPVYGDGKAVRDWLHVEDHCAAIDLVLRQGEPGEAYNVGAGNERTILENAHLILDELGKPRDLIQFVQDRPGHDRRYALNCDKLRSLGWEPRQEVVEGLRETVLWYAANRDWWERARARSRAYFEAQYAERLRPAQEKK
jgi:dTDP-glucose 4,6-dehydratase